MAVVVPSPSPIDVSDLLDSVALPVPVLNMDNETSSRNCWLCVQLMRIDCHWLIIRRLIRSNFFCWQTHNQVNGHMNILSHEGLVVRAVQVYP